MPRKTSDSKRRVAVKSREWLIGLIESHNITLPKDLPEDILGIVKIAMSIDAKMRTEAPPTQYEDRLVIRKSQIDDAGMGLYTTIDIPARAFVIEYKGVHRPNDDHDDHSYCYAITDDTCIDATIESKSNKARFINDVVNTELLPNLNWFITDDNRAWYVATKNIKAGEELFAPYGEEYWESDDESEDAVSLGDMSSTEED